MTFTDEERRDWHLQKRLREAPPAKPRPAPVAVCLHCSNLFGEGDGAVTEEAAICDVCNGD